MMIDLRKKIQNQKGFTLVELMVVIAILGVLATIGITKMTDATASANGAKIVSDLRTIDGMINVVQASGRPVAAGAITAAANADLYNTLGGTDADVPKPPQSGKYMTKQVAATAVVASGTYTIVADGSTFKAAYNNQKLSDLN